MRNGRKTQHFALALIKMISIVNTDLPVRLWALFLSVQQISFCRGGPSVVRACLDLELMGKSTLQCCRVTGVRMISMLIVIYLGGLLTVTFAAHAVGRRLTDSEAPPDHPLLVSLAAGAVWPLLVVGLVELSSVIVLTRVQPKAASEVGILA